MRIGSFMKTIISEFNTTSKSLDRTKNLSYIVIIENIKMEEKYVQNIFTLYRMLTLNPK